jgi:ribosomal-protein-alanine N-acetyltransferase
MASSTDVLPNSGSISAPPDAILTLSKAIVRPFAISDAESLAKVANNPKVAHTLRNIFPSPYTLADAVWWVNFCASQAPDARRNFALVHPTTGEVMGGIGITPDKDVHCRTAELGYWLGEEYWGNGIMSEVVAAFVDWTFANVKVRDKADNEMGLTRVWAAMFDGNKGSESVAKKAGFEYEGKMRASVWTHGVVMDQLLYSIIKDDWEAKGKSGSAQ